MSIYQAMWLLLPVALFLLTLWALTKRIFGAKGREYARDYWRETMFTAAVFALSVYLDNHVVDDASHWLDRLFAIDVQSLRWLLYPAMLVICAFIPEWYQRMKLQEEQRKRQTQGKSLSAVTIPSQK